MTTGQTLTVQLGNANSDDLPGFQNPQYMYNGVPVPPVLAVPDVLTASSINLTVNNQVAAADSSTYPFTNVHYHGMNVSPLNPDPAASVYGDNVFVQITPGNIGTYDVVTPPGHPRGTFWYHPHPHETTESQVLGGMSGALVVGKLIETYYADTLLPYLAVPTFDQLLLLKDYVPQDSSPVALGSSCAVKSVNGQVAGTLNVAANVPQLLRLANVGADQFYDIQIRTSLDPASAVTMYIVAVDGNPTACYNETEGTSIACPVEATHLFLPPGGRMDVLVQLELGDHYLWTLPVGTAPPANASGGDPNCEQQLGWISATSTSNLPPFDLSTLTSNVVVPDRLPYSQLVTKYDPANPCTKDNNSTASSGPTLIPFSIAADNPNGFSIRSDQKQYVMDHVDISIDTLPCLAQWNITNTTDPGTNGETHVFHIHQTDFVLENEPLCGPGGNPPQNCVIYRDTVAVPWNQQVTAMIPFNSIVKGPFVYHCHILNHEDLGMMANICASDPCNDITGGTTSANRRHH